jgi:hypothetical protein
LQKGKIQLTPKWAPLKKWALWKRCTISNSLNLGIDGVNNELQALAAGERPDWPIAAVDLVIKRTILPLKCINLLKTEEPTNITHQHSSYVIENVI